MRAVGRQMVILQAKVAVGDDRAWPVNTLLHVYSLRSPLLTIFHQNLSAKLVIMHHPPFSLIVFLGPHDSGLVSP